ncbi:MAG: type III-A CRISPR-associated RAMP protein Csm5 [Anaerolineae bacterium]|nr:type III-A CRISPR-associated RAMP protein Csm5 [Anaerolineales bacterium]MCQ3978449.1 type III-A CRISPR-associated RAMP protein Csm5 [Anaerolineae bacterium]
MNYKPQPKQFQFKTVSPVFVGSGNDIKPLSFVATANTVYVIDDNRLFNSLSAKEQEHYLNWIDPIVEQMSRLEQQIQQAKETRNEDARKSLTPQLRNLEAQLSIQEFIQRRMRPPNAEQFVKQRNCIAYQVEMIRRPETNGFKACLKDAQNRPYLPGTEIKGALRTALLFALLEEPAHYQVLKEGIQNLKPFVNDPNRLKREMPKVIDKVENEILRGGKDDAKFDLLRLVRVTDTLPFETKNLLLERSKSVGTNRQTDAIVETIKRDLTGQFRLEMVEDQPELLTQLGLNARSEQVNWSYLLSACYKHSAAILEAEVAYFTGRYEEVARRVEELHRKNTPQTPLLRLGGGQGLLSITTDLWLRHRDPDVYEIFRQAVSKLRRWNNTQPDNFPKTRRVIYRNNQPVELLGWIQLIPPEEIQNKVKTNIRTEPVIQNILPPAPKTVSTTPTESATNRRKGQVKRFDTAKGYGFIKPAGGGGDIFVHISQVEGGQLREGDTVSFFVGPGKKGLEAKNVKREK